MKFLCAEGCRVEGVWYKELFSLHPIPYTFHLISYQIHFPFQLNSKFFVHRFCDVFAQVKNFFTGSASVIHQYKRLFCMTTSITFAKSFPSTLFYHPPGG